MTKVPKVDEVWWITKEESVMRGFKPSEITSAVGVKKVHHQQKCFVTYNNETFTFNDLNRQIKNAVWLPTANDFVMKFGNKYDFGYADINLTRGDALRLFRFLGEQFDYDVDD